MSTAERKISKLNHVLFHPATDFPYILKKAEFDKGSYEYMRINSDIYRIFHLFSILCCNHTCINIYKFNDYHVYA